MRAAVALLVTLVSGVTLAQSPDPKALLEKSIAFHGGKAALASLPDVKETGTIETPGRSAGRARDFVAYERGDGGRRTEVTFEFRGRQVTAIEIYDGKMCKQRFDVSGHSGRPITSAAMKNDSRIEKRRGKTQLGRARIASASARGVKKARRMRPRASKGPRSVRFAGGVADVIPTRWCPGALVIHPGLRKPRLQS